VPTRIHGDLGMIQSDDVVIACRTAAEKDEKSSGLLEFIRRSVQSSSR